MLPGRALALSAQALRSGDQVLAVSSWTSAEDTQRYLGHEVPVSAPSGADTHARLAAFLGRQSR